jgi:predicted dehydrogenase
MSTKKSNKKKLSTDRRSFMQASAVAGVGFWAAGGIAPKPSRSALEEIRWGCIGVGGKGDSDSTNVSAEGKVVAICDIDEDNLDKKGEEFGDAKKFIDYRKMFEEMGDDIDAITVSVPDHMHAVISLEAMRMGKAVYCQKPLTHSIEEARMMGTVARETGVATQMGNQFTADSNMRESAALIQKGIVGDIQEVHFWSNRPVWPQSYDLKVKTQPDSGEEGTWNARAKKVHWKEWLGCASPQDYSPEIHPFKWRGFWKFGTGALGDMACHTMNMAYMALALKNPTSVEAEYDKHDGVCFPASSKITFQFPATDDRPALKMVWYDGGRMPGAETLAGVPRYKDGGKEKHYKSAALLIGDKGKFYSPGDYGEIPRHTGVVDGDDFIRINKITRAKEGDEESVWKKFQDVEYTRSPGHVKELADAIKGGPAAVSNFPEYSGPLVETLLLGNLALWSGKKVEWNAAEMIAKDADEETQKLIRHDYPDEYTIHATAGVSG